MPGRRNPPAKWVLPAVVDPPDSICITIPVPNDRQHIGAFWGALYNLTSARFWSDDTAHTALQVAKVWQDIYDALAPDTCNPKLPIPIEEWEDELSICESLRFQDGKLQGLCCGEWTDIPGQGDSSLGGPGQPGGGADQPTPGGGQACYHANMPGAYQWLAPTVVNGGDVLTFSHFDGAAWDGVSPFPLPGRWDCPDGKYFFAGECQDGTEALIGGDPLPTAPHMSLITQIDGTWYSCLSPVTVPGGVTNAQVMVQLNDGSIGDNQGQYAFDLCVTNNQTADWTHVFDLTLSPGGFVLVPNGGNPLGVWTAGVGWQATIDPVNASHWLELYIHRILTATTIVSVEVFYTSHWTTNTQPGSFHHYTQPNVISSNVAPDQGTGISKVASGTAAATTEIVVDYNSGGTNGGSLAGATLNITKIQVKGQGTDPF